MSPLSKAAFVAALVLLTGCAGNLGAGNLASANFGTGIATDGFTPSLDLQRISRAHSLTPLAPPCATAPSVWSSDIYNARVYGRDTAGTLICQLGAGLPMGLATNAGGHLFVPDRLNDDVTEYKSRGQFVHTISTDIAGSPFQPVGVCISRTGKIGVANWANDINGATNVEFFSPSGTMIGYATAPSLASARFCAFDKAGDFFVDGSATAGAGGGQQIWYLARGDIGPNATLTLSGLGNASYWLGMFSQINTALPFTLSIASPPVSGGGCSTYCAPITTFQIGNGTSAPPPHGPIPLAVYSTCNVTNYPNANNAVFQAAPLGSTLYIADYDTNSLQGAASICTPGGGTATVTTTISAFGAYGVATNPTGQY